MKAKLQKVLALTTLGLAAYSGAAAAQQATLVTDPGWYVGANAGYNRLSDSNNSISGTNTVVTPQTIQSLNVLGLGLIGNGSSLLNTGNTLDGLCSGQLLGLSLSPLLCKSSTAGGTSSSTAANSFTTSFKAGFAAGLTTGYSFNNGLRPELSVTYRKNDYNTVSSSGSATTSADGSRTSISGMGNLWFDFFDKTSNWRPYIGAGVGANNVKLSGGGSSVSKTAFAYQAGAGLSYFMSKKDVVSLDYRYLASNNITVGQIKTDYKANTLMLGYRHYLGEGQGSPVAPVAPVVPVAVVPPVNPKCPSFPAGVALGSDGCPLDSDGDGVPDYLDKCPNTPPGQKVGADGCPLDSDGDGIPDDQDECPNTPAGAKVLPNGCALKGDCRRPRAGEQVDEHGCALEHNFILKGVKFEFDSDRLTEAAKLILNQVAETLKAYPEVNVEVQGHTDYIGTDAYNLGLSEKRSIAVKTYLVGHGVDAKRLSPVGYGKTRPIDTNETEAGRENNRRVELKVQD